MCLPATVGAVPVTGSDSTSTELPLVLARDYESRGKWGEACDEYEKILARDRNQPEIRKHFLYCFRQCLRKYRHTDAAFSEQVLSSQYKLREALDFYRDAVQKVQELYVDSDRVQINRLFQEGLEELAMDLDDADFRQKYLPRISLGSVQEFRAALKMRWGTAKVATFADARELVREVAREASKKIKLNSRLVVVEMACGSCNALDEYSFYLTQSDAASVRSMHAAIETKVLEDAIGYIRLHTFQENTVAELKAALEYLKREGVRALILDLRDNPGGSVEISVQVVEHFIPAPMALAATAGKIKKTYRSYNLTATDLPMWVLIDGETASAAELVAGTLKAYQRAELIGQTTFGKNWVQKSMPVRQAPYGAIRITWAQFYTPKTHDLSKRGGIVPNIVVDAARSMGSDHDQQLQIAINRAREVVDMMMMGK